MKDFELNSYLIEVGIAIAVVIILVKVVSFLLYKSIDKSILFHGKRYETLLSVFNTSFKFVGFLVILIIALNPFFDVTKILAGAGVLGIVLGFGAQSLIKDILTGFFFVFENQFHKGDFVTINNKYSGTVEEVGFRALKVRDWGGKLLTISNGNIVEILNGNVNTRRIVEGIIVSYDEDPKRIIGLLNNLCDEMTELYVGYLMRDENLEIMEPFKLRGLMDFTKSVGGFEYTIVCLVEDSNYFDITYKVREHLAQFIYDNKIKLAETRVKMITELTEQNK